MAARKDSKAHACSECGAELTLRPARCPLCGSGAARPEVTAVPDIEDYQDNVRQLRDELIRLRGETKRAG